MSQGGPLTQLAQSHPGAVIAEWHIHQDGHSLRGCHLNWSASWSPSGHLSCNGLSEVGKRVWELILARLAIASQGLHKFAQRGAPSPLPTRSEMGRENANAPAGNGRRRIWTQMNAFPGTESRNAYAKRLKFNIQDVLIVRYPVASLFLGHVIHVPGLKSLLVPGCKLSLPTRDIGAQSDTATTNHA